MPRSFLRKVQNGKSQETNSRNENNDYLTETPAQIGERFYQDNGVYVQDGESTRLVEEMMIEETKDKDKDKVGSSGDCAETRPANSEQLETLTHQNENVDIALESGECVQDEEMPSQVKDCFQESGDCVQSEEMFSQLKDEGTGADGKDDVTESVNEGDEEIPPDSEDPENRRLEILKMVEKIVTYVNNKQVIYYKCPICGKLFKQHYSFGRHIVVHTGERRFKCDECGKLFRQSSTLCRHRVVHNEERKYKCPQCPATFRRSSTLDNHKKTHSETKAFVCKECNMGFHQKGNLTTHMRTHTGEKPFKCDDCYKSFGQKSNLTSHVAAVHKLLTCDMCPETFKRKRPLNAHKMIMHPTSKLTKSDKLRENDKVSSAKSQVPKSSYKPVPYKKLQELREKSAENPQKKMYLLVKQAGGMKMMIPMDIVKVVMMGGKGNSDNPIHQILDRKSENPNEESSSAAVPFPVTLENAQDGGLSAVDFTSDGPNTVDSAGVCKLPDVVDVETDTGSSEGQCSTDILSCQPRMTIPITEVVVPATVEDHTEDGETSSMSTSCVPSVLYNQTNTLECIQP